MAAATHRLPDALGAAECELIGGPAGSTAKVRLTTGMPGITLELPAAALTALASPPPEPRNGCSGQALTDGNTVWLRSMDGWFDGFDVDSRVLTWEKLHAQSPRVRPLVEERELAALLTLKTAATAWVERIQHPVGIWGDDQDQALLDAAVALGAKYTPDGGR